MAVVYGRVGGGLGKVFKTATWRTFSNKRDLHATSVASGMNLIEKIVQLHTGN